MKCVVASICQVKKPRSPGLGAFSPGKAARWVLKYLDFFFFESVFVEPKVGPPEMVLGFHVTAAAIGEGQRRLGPWLWSTSSR